MFRARTAALLLLLGLGACTREAGSGGQGAATRPSESAELLMLRERVKALDEILRQHDEQEKRVAALRPTSRRFDFVNRSGETFHANGLVVFASDPDTGSFGWAVLSVCPAAAGQIVDGKVGVGAAAVLGSVNLTLKQRALELLASGKSPADVVATLCADPSASRALQLAVMAPDGKSAVFRGGALRGVEGEERGERWAVVGCELVGYLVLQAAAAKLAGTAGKPLPERLLDALTEARLAPLRAPGGVAGASASAADRPMLSGALVVLREGGSLDGIGDRLVDLRVDFDPEPIGTLRTAYDAWVKASIIARLKSFLRGAPDSKRSQADRAWLESLRK